MASDNEPNLLPESDWAIPADVSSFAEQTLSQQKGPGLAVAAVQLSGSGKARTAFGAWGRMTEEGVKLTADTLFAIGSCSKAFLASAIGILMDDFAQGRNTVSLPPGVRAFTWDTKVQDLFPGESDWLLADPWATAKASVRDILAHVSGLAGHDLSYSDTDTIPDVIRRMRHLKSTYELRERISYNNQMYMLAAHIVASYAGMSFTEFVKQRIFIPLCMDSTTYSAEEAEKSGQLSQCWITTGRRIPFWFKPGTAEAIAGPGGIISSTRDMAKWLATLLNHGVDPLSEAIIIPPTVFEETTRAHYIASGVSTDKHTSIRGCGLGWARLSYRGREVIIHTGGIPGFSSIVMFLPSDNVGMVALTNTDGSLAACSTVLSQIVDRVLGLQHFVDSLINPPSTLKQDGQDAKQANQEPHSVPLEQYSGTYSNPGYGTFTLCTPSTDSAPCQKVIADYKTCKQFAEGQAALYAAWPRMWSSHVRLRHHTKEVFLFSHSYLFPHGYGKDTTPFVYRQLGDKEVPAEFLVREGKVVGLGIIDVVFDQRRSPKTDGDVEQRADVWFAKVA